MAEQYFTVGEPNDAPAQQQPQQSGANPNFDYASFGTFSWMYNADPQVRGLIDQASREKWPPEKLAAAIQGTGWWRSMVQSERQWNQLIAEDPRTALEKRDRKSEEISKQAQQMGITLRPGVADSFADSFYRYGWSDIQLENSLLSQFTYERGKTFGLAATTEQALRRASGDYMVPLDDQTMQQWIVSIEQGRTSEETFRAYLAQIAAADNPWMRSALDQGFSVKQIMAPYLSRAAQELGMAVEEIDLSDPKWRQILELTDDKGERIRPTTQQVLKLVRSDSRFGWDKTDAALEASAQFSRELATTFGAIG